VQGVASPVRKGVSFISSHYWLFFLVVIIPLTLVVSHLSYHFLECPLRDLLRGNAKTNPIASTPTADVTMESQPTPALS
jgi:peptidoglycan/LPS O-acetylase OafA/YrhL